MVKGLELFKRYFEEYSDQYVLIGGTACDVNFEENSASFRATKDLDMVLIVEALTPEFGQMFWQFIQDGSYRNKRKNDGKPQFYRFDKPQADGFPKMIELFSRADSIIKEPAGLTPVRFDDEVSSLSGILLNDEYYECLLKGRTVIDRIPVLCPEYLILFKAKAYMDLKARKESGEDVKSTDILKHHKDIVRLSAVMILNRVEDLPRQVYGDIKSFIEGLDAEPFNGDVLKEYGLKTEQIKERLEKIFI